MISKYSRPFSLINEEISNNIQSSYQEISGETYEQELYKLGVGWSFMFPSIQISAGNYKYYHDGNGQAYEIKTTLSTAGDNLLNYTGTDKFLRDYGTYSHGQFMSYYKLVTSDKKTTHFDEKGRLLGIKDRFGNEIKFTYTGHSEYQAGYSSYKRGYISQITDSIGRTVTLVYDQIAESSNTLDHIAVTVTDPNNTQSVSFGYTKTTDTVGVYDQDDYYLYNISADSLWRVTDFQGNNIYYGYEVENNPFDLMSYSYEYDSSSAASVPVKLLTTVTYPHTRTNYDYEPVERGL